MDWAPPCLVHRVRRVRHVRRAAKSHSVPSQELIQQGQVPSHLVLVPGEICVGPMRLAMKPQLFLVVN